MYQQTEVRTVLANAVQWAHQPGVRVVPAVRHPAKGWFHPAG